MTRKFYRESYQRSGLLEFTFTLEEINKQPLFKATLWTSLLQNILITSLDYVQQFDHSVWWNLLYFLLVIISHTIFRLTHLGYPQKTYLSSLRAIYLYIRLIIIHFIFKIHSFFKWLTLFVFKITIIIFIIFFKIQRLFEK